MTAASRFKAALEVPAVLLFAWYLRASCSRLGKKSGGIDDERRGTLRSLGPLLLPSSDEFSPPTNIPPIGLQTWSCSNTIARRE